MITAVSIGLYLMAAVLAAMVGVAAEEYSRNRGNKAPGRIATVSFLIVFVMAAALQVAA